MKRENCLMVIVSLLIALSTIPCFSQETYEFLLEWGSRGSRVSEFNFPTAVATDSSGSVYVVDPGNNRIQKFDPDGNFIRMFDLGGIDPSGLSKTPHSISTDSTGNVYAVVSIGTTTPPAPPPQPYIYKFDSNGSFISRWSISGTIVTDSDIRRGVTVDSSENVYVVDTLNNWIQKFDSNGKLLTQWGSSGTGDGQLDHPGGVAVDSRGHIYVADTWNQRTQKFDSSGHFLHPMGFLPWL